MFTQYNIVDVIFYVLHAEVKGVIFMALERRGDYVYGTQSEIDAYRSQQADSQAASAIGGAVAVAGIAVILGVAALFISASASIKDKARISAEQIRTWHGMYSKLWGKEKADTVLYKARKKLRFRTFKYCIMGMLFPIIYIAGLPLLLGILFVLPVLLAAETLSATQALEIFPFSLSEFWHSIRQDGLGELFQRIDAEIGGYYMLIGIVYLVMIAIIVPIYANIAKKSADSALLSKYNILIYQNYPKARCPHCRRKTRILSLGQCRECFKFLRHLSFEDAKAISEYRMTVNYDIFKTESNEFFSAEIGRTLQWRRAWFLVLLMFFLPIALFMGGIYTGALFVLPYIANDSSSGGFFPPELLIILGTIIGSLLLTLGSTKILGKISTGISKSDIRKFANAVKTELSKYNLPVSNWNV